MSVDSYLELFTSLFGWTFYGILWDVLVGTGIVYLPFLGILIDNWREPAQGGEVGHASGLSLRRMEIELFIALLVVVLAGQPAALTPLNAATLSYSPPPTLLDPTPATATVAAPQSTYGTTGFAGSAATVNVPIWWYSVIALSSGLNHAIVEGMPTVADMRTFEQQAHLATIADPRLRQEVSDFFSQCYIPARSNTKLNDQTQRRSMAVSQPMEPMTRIGWGRTSTGIQRVTTTPCVRPVRSRVGRTTRPEIRNMTPPYRQPGANLTANSGGTMLPWDCARS